MLLIISASAGYSTPKYCNTAQRDVMRCNDKQISVIQRADTCETDSLWRYIHGAPCLSKSRMGPHRHQDTSFLPRVADIAK